MRIRPSFPWLKLNPGHFNLHVLTPSSIYYNTQYVVLGTLCCLSQRLISWNIKCWLQKGISVLFCLFFESVHITAKNVSSLITWYETKSIVFSICVYVNGMFTFRYTSVALSHYSAKEEESVFRSTSKKPFLSIKIWKKEKEEQG